MLLMNTPYTAAAQRLIDATVEISRLALYLNLEPTALRDALGVCGITVTKDKHNTITEHEALFPDWQQIA